MLVKSSSKKFSPRKIRSLPGDYIATITSLVWSKDHHETRGFCNIIGYSFKEGGETDGTCGTESQIV